MSDEAKFNPAKFLTKLKGKDYLEVKWRVLWLTEDAKEHTYTYTIQNRLHSIDEKMAIFCSTISLYDCEGKKFKEVTGWGQEERKDFGDYLEKAETKAMGRALAVLGYGTQFAAELDEGDGQVVDAPVVVKGRAPWEKKA